MGLLSDLEGCKAERMTSALLRRLILDCPLFREGFSNLLSRELNEYRSMLDFSAGVLCTCEHYLPMPSSCTKKNDPDSASNSYGIADIYLQTADSVLIIENKLWAGFQDRQLKRYARYLNTLAPAAEEPSDSEQDETAPMESICICPDRYLVVLCTSARKADIEKEPAPNVEGNDVRYAIVFWEDVLKILGEVEEKVAKDETGFTVKLFREYLDDMFSCPWLQYMDSLKMQICEKRANKYQRQMLRDLQYLINQQPDFETGRLCTSKHDSAGFYIRHKMDAEPKGPESKTCRPSWIWFGLVRREDGKDGNKISRLVIQASKSCPDPWKELHTGESREGLESRIFEEDKKGSGWSIFINYTDEWKTIPDWSRQLEPVLNALREIHEQEREQA